MGSKLSKKISNIYTDPKRSTSSCDVHNKDLKSHRASVHSVGDKSNTFCSSKSSSFDKRLNSCQKSLIYQDFCNKLNIGSSPALACHENEFSYVTESRMQTSPSCSFQYSQHISTPNHKTKHDNFQTNLTSNLHDSIVRQSLLMISPDISPSLVSKIEDRRKRKRVKNSNEVLPKEDDAAPTSNVLLRVKKMKLDDCKRLSLMLREDKKVESNVVDFLDGIELLLKLVPSSGSAGKPDTSPTIAMCDCCEKLNQTVDGKFVGVEFVQRNDEEFFMQPHKKSGRPLSDSFVGSSYQMPGISLSLKHECLCESRVRRLQSILKSESINLVKLELSHTTLNDACKIRLGHAIGLNQTLCSLTINSCRLEDDGLLHLCLGLKNNYSITELNLENNFLTAFSCLKLIKTIAKQRRIKSLNISNNSVSNEFCQYLAIYLLDGNIPLKEIILRNCDVTNTGASFIFTKLYHNFRLCLLDLSGNPICDESIVILAETLVKNRALEHLNISCCNLSCKSTCYISRFLKSNSSLKHLDISQNLIEDSGFFHIVDGLRMNRGLTTLSVNDCGITKNGLSYLVDSLHISSKLTSLNIDGMGIQDSEMALFKLQVKESNPVLYKCLR